MADSLRNFPKSFNNASKCLQIRLPKFKIEIGSTKSKDNDKILLNIKIDIFVYRSDFKTINFAFLPSKKFGLHANQFKITEIVHLNHREKYHLYKNRYYLANNSENIESNYDEQNIHP